MTDDTRVSQDPVQKPAAAGSATPTAQAAQTEIPRTTGATVGMCVACWFITGAVCATLTWVLCSSLGYAGSSTGGFASLVIGIVLGVRYRTDARKDAAGRALGYSAIAGAILVVCVYIIVSGF